MKKNIFTTKKYTFQFCLIEFKSLSFYQTYLNFRYYIFSDLLHFYPKSAEGCVKLKQEVLIEFEHTESLKHFLKKN